MGEPGLYAMATAASLPNPWARISEIAARVGVAPRESGPPTVSMKGADGKDYDLWEVIAKFSRPHGCAFD